MALLQSQSALQRMQQKADPQLLLTNKLLQMSTMELQQCLATEIADNPALEEDEFPCDRCEAPGPGCLGCPYNSGEFRAQNVDSWNDRSGAAREDDDPFTFVESPVSLEDHLRAELRAVATEAELIAGDYLVSNLDPDGYLRCSLQECAEAVGCTLTVVESALRRIQSLDPPGVGARGLQECLTIQAEVLDAEDRLPPLVLLILKRFWKQLGSRRYKQIAHGLRCSPAEIVAAVNFIRGNLSPYPGRQFRPHWDKRSHRSESAVQVDVAFYIDEDDQLRVAVTQRQELTIHVSSGFLAIWQRMRDAPTDFSPGERKQVQDYINRATMFLKGLKDRKAIVEQVAQCILEEQGDYLRSERDEDQRPLTQSRLALYLRVHESTVSRSVADKYARLPSGRVVPISFFFDRSLSLRKQVANIIATEDRNRPYSDQEISDLLSEQGIHIARRTVMKYREEMNILSSRQRARRGRQDGARIAA